jgi:hypothetical protein
MIDAILRCGEVKGGGRVSDWNNIFMYHSIFTKGKMDIRRSSSSKNARINDYLYLQNNKKGV